MSRDFWTYLGARPAEIDAQRDRRVSAFVRADAPDEIVGRGGAGVPVERKLMVVRSARLLVLRREVETALYGVQGGGGRESAVAELGQRALQTGRRVHLADRRRMLRLSRRSVVYGT